MTDYSKTVIYKIQHLDKDELLYVGHTTNFTKRKHQHKCESKSSQELLYRMIRENGGWEYFTMIVNKEYPCASKTEACIEEDKIMREMKSSMNNYRAYNTPEQISERRKVNYQLNKEKCIEKAKEHYQSNKIKINQQQREPLECECGCIIRKSDLARHKKSKKHLNLII
jgi:predicted GIY-YIG superfamily endonuclease